MPFPCPVCASPMSVTETRDVHRHRKCSNAECGHRLWTHEVVTDALTYNALTGGQTMQKKRKAKTIRKEESAALAERFASRKPKEIPRKQVASPPQISLSKRTVHARNFIADLKSDTEDGDIYNE